MKENPSDSIEKLLPEWAVLIKRLYEEARKEQEEKLKSERKF